MILESEILRWLSDAHSAICFRLLIIRTCAHVTIALAG